MDSKIINQAYSLLKDFLSESNSKTIDEINASAEEVINMTIFNKDNIDKTILFNEIVDKYQSNIGVKAYEAEVLRDESENDMWFYKTTGVECDFFERYKYYLRSNDFPEDSIDKMETKTKEILSYCADPNNDSDIKRRKKKGLVMGDVQSGKTANYLALMNMAADYGYKVIVLLSGLTESLRIQTQKRVDAGFVGAVSDTIGSANINFIGVGEVFNLYYAIPMTNQIKDFNKNSLNNNSSANDYNKPLIFVVKKVKSVLEQMSTWLKPDQINISSKNILIIDDESDNASINTKSGEDPSIINKLIRNLFNNFPIATYIGFTATPFANIFIDPYDDEANKDLFPSDFIVQLRAPSNYFGLDKLFETDNGKYTHIRELDENEPNFLQVIHKKDDLIFIDLPTSLKESIYDFLIANVIRTLRGNKTSHRTMMINISRFNKKQEEIYEKVSEYINKLRIIIEQTYNLSFAEFIKNEDVLLIYKYYSNSDFYKKIRDDISWDQIQAGLFDEINQVRIEIINARNPNRFNYDDYADIGARLIAIGGFVLSRGLTLEGLIVSYYSRSSNAYDTVLQMCRWFGYRNKYEDLCRVYISGINIDCFGAIYDAVNDLKEQFSRMKVEGKKPRDFGLAVKESPDTLETMMLVTSRNKMKNAILLERSLNYSGRYVDTSKLFVDKEKNLKNRSLILDFTEKIKQSGIILTKVNNRYIFKDVNKHLVSKLISQLNITVENKKFNKEALSSFIDTTDSFFKIDVVIANGDDTTDENMKWNFCGMQIPKVVRKFEYREGESYLRISGTKNRLAEPGIFKAGLNDNQIKQALESANRRQDNKNQPIASDYLSVSNRKPLLVIYPLSLHSQENEYSDIIDTYYGENVLLGFALGIPGTENYGRVKYRANKVLLDELNNDIEYDDEEDAVDEY